MTRPIQTLSEFKSLIDAVQIVALYADEIGASYAGLLFRSGMLKIMIPYSHVNRPYVSGEAPWEWARLRALIETICAHADVILSPPAQFPDLDLDRAYGELWITKAELNISAHEELAAFNRLEWAFRRFGVPEPEIERLLAFRAPGDAHINQETFMTYELTTTLNGSQVTVRCEEPTARVLLPLWAKAEPNLTHCRNLATDESIVCFLEPTDDTPATETLRS